MSEQAVTPPSPASALPHVGTYRRVLPVSLERMYENALDWEHLPHLHDSSFGSIDCEEAGSWGWRARTTDAEGAESLIELRLDRDHRRWITRNLEGPHAGSEIWTHAFDIEPRRVDIVVDFFVPGVPADIREKVGAGYAALYSILYDEDVSMMVERQRQIDARIDTAGDDGIYLGKLDALELPMTAECAGRSVVVASVDGELTAFSATCPHMLGPLAGQPIENGCVTCPWHGYRFDVRSGACQSGQHLKLPPIAHVEIGGGEVWLKPGARG